MIRTTTCRAMMVRSKIAAARCRRRPFTTRTAASTANGGTNSSSSFSNKQHQQSSSSLLRFDFMTGTWVVFSAGRRNRPQQTESKTTTKLRLADLPQTVTNCPFCAGNEHLTPQELLTRNDMRVVPNKYPAIAPLEAREEGGQTCPHHPNHDHQHHPMSSLFNDGVILNNQAPAIGFHEVVIESPHHNRHIATAPSSSSDMARDLLTIFRDRGREHRNSNPEIEHTVFFKNHGGTAGASLVHPHSQIVSTTVVPVEAQRLQSLALDYFQRHRCNLYERLVAEELTVHYDSQNSAAAITSRVVDLTENFIALVPYASAGPYVIKILPRFQASGRLNDEDDPDHSHVGLDSSDFTTTTDALLSECAALLQRCLYRLHQHLDEPDFNLVVQTAPVARRGVQAAVCASTFFRWHIRITPRLGAGAMAGFELGSGFFSNSHMPEDDAAELRAVVPASS